MSKVDDNILAVYSPVVRFMVTSEWMGRNGSDITFFPIDQDGLQNSL